MDLWLNRITNLALIVLACVAVFIGLRSTPSSAAPDTAAYAPGDQLDAGRLGLQQQTLVIATKSTCRFCTDSLPFYRSLDGLPIVWIATGEDLETNRNYLESNGIRPLTVLTTDASGLDQIRATPTVMLVSRSGEVLKMWNGRLNPAGEQDVRNAVKRESEE